jgi:hypothetical protein
MLPRPAADEAAPFYGKYLAAVPDGRVGARLDAQARELESLCASLSDTGALFRYADGKWTIKEVIGHLLDAERVFAYRLLRIGRGDATELPGYDENSYAPAGRFNERSLGDLLSEFRLQRASTGALVNGMPAEAWARIGSANGHPVSARALAYVIVGHTAHHFAILRERYSLPRGREGRG